MPRAATVTEADLKRALSRDHIPAGTWPALMRRDMAAAYLDLSQSSFDAKVKEGALPAPVAHMSPTRWRRSDLDDAISPGGNPVNTADKLLGMTG